MKKRNKANKVSCDETDDWCFLCKDGGDLIVCDHRGCLKVYHARCVGKDETSLDTGRRWACDRHTCFVCRKSTKIYCFCCPNAVCGSCNSASEFARVRGNGGFCDECVKLILLIEEKADYDSEGEKLHFDDRDTHECLFKEYWEIIKEREGLTLEDVYSADVRLKKGKNYNSDSDPFEISNSEGTDESASEIDEDDKVKRSRGTWAYESVSRSGEDDKLKRSNGKRTRESASESDEDEVKRPRGKGKRSGRKFQEFEGWGSKPLIHFLSSTGEDTTKELSRFDVDTIISRYIHEKDLCDPEKRRSVRCDEKLYAIFRKKKINRNKMYHLLEPHFLDNVVHSDEDKEFSSNGTIAWVRGMKAKGDGKKQRKSYSNRKSKEKEVVQKVQEVPKIQQSCFAAVNAHNLKLVYLRRSFVEELFKEEPQTAEGKIVGSFVKVKMDPTYQQFKSSHQLLKVKGLKQESTATGNTEILLEVSNLSKPVNIKMLSDTDISEEECEDLRQSVENGVAEKLNVAELQQKARSLHEVITKLSIEKEIVLLQNLIERANEKGWRRDTKAMYLEKKALLKTPSEQERRLKQVPMIMPENVKLDPTASSFSSGDDSESNEEGSAGSLPHHSRGNSKFTGRTLPGLPCRT